MSRPTVREVRQRGFEDGRTAAAESGDSSAPDGGWDTWLLNGIGILAACDVLGIRPPRRGEGWSDEAKRRMSAYDVGAKKGAASAATTGLR